VVAGTIAVPAEAADCAPDELGPALAPRVGREPTPIEHAATEIVDDHIGIGQKAFEQRTVAIGVKVRRQAELVSIDTEVVSAAALIVEWRPPAAGVVAGAG